jgi:hypothetical protein
MLTSAASADAVKPDDGNLVRQRSDTAITFGSDRVAALKKEAATSLATKYRSILQLQSRTGLATLCN